MLDPRTNAPDNRPFVIPTILLALASYLIGAIPFGYLLVKLLRGIDVRTIGSRSLGATNVSRALGMKWFVVVFLLDFAKGFGPAFGLGSLAVSRFGAPGEVGIIYGLLAMAGHIWPVYLRFKGGKGVATATGAVMGIAPAATGIAAVAFAVTFLAFRYISLGSIAAACCLPFAYWILHGRAAFSWTLLALVVMSVIVIVKHRTNVRRLLAGTENRIGRKSESPEA